MCSTRSVRRTRACVTALGVIVLLGAAAEVEAQTADEYRVKVDRLAARLDTVQALVQAREANAVPLESIRVGRLHVLVRPEHHVSFAEVLAAAWDSLSATLGVDTMLIRAFPLYAHHVGDSLPRLPQSPPGVGQHLVRSPEEREQAAADLARFYLRILWDETDASLRAWIWSPSGFDSLSSTLAEVVYVELATKPWDGVKACREGDLEACARVLDLEVADDTVSLWYTAEEQRRAVVDQVNRWWVRPTTAYRACVDGSSAACAAYLNDGRRWIMGAPLSERTRESLLRVALEIGGDGALGRLVGTPTAETGTRLAATAGIARDSLLAVWRERVLAAAPPQVIITGVTGVTAMLWSLVLVVLALRSTRWRDR